MIQRFDPEKVRKFIVAVFNPQRHVDYLLVAGFAALPAVFAYCFDAHVGFSFEGMEYQGYFERLNWMALMVILPVELYFLRTAIRRIAPLTVSNEQPVPALVQLVEDQTAAERVHQRLYQALTDPRNFSASIVLACALNLVDAFELLLCYAAPAGCLPREADWSVFFVPGHLPWMSNLVLVVFAYSVQWLASFLVFLFIALLLRNNIFFLQLIFQRRRVGKVAQDELVVIDLDDGNRRFGFGDADHTFNTQVRCLVLAGLAIVVSRFANVDERLAPAIYETVELESLTDLPKTVATLITDIESLALLPDVGQWILAISWLTFLAVVSIPALVKMLPRLGRRRPERTLQAYLREFLPKELEDWPDDAPDEVTGPVAEKFAQNSFWPTGDNKAAILFFFSFVVFLVVLIPLRYSEQYTLAFLAYYLVVSVCALFLTTVALKSLNLYLWSVHELLVKERKP